MKKLHAETKCLKEASEHSFGVREVEEDRSRLATNSARHTATHVACEPDRAIISITPTVLMHCIRACALHTHVVDHYVHLHSFSRCSHSSFTASLADCWYCSNCSSDLTDKKGHAQTSLSECYGTVATACQMSQTSTSKLRQACQIAKILQEPLVRSHRQAQPSSHKLGR